MKVFIGGAWPYANGSLHIGHISGLIAGDVIARYHRLAGNDVCYVSGSDCYGTPITIRARKENKSPDEISRYYHDEFVKVFNYFNFSYDHYGRTTSKQHRSFVREFHENLYKSDYVYEKDTLQAFCETCGKYLPDRLLTGTCPVCENDTLGDQCEFCGSVFEASEVKNPQCGECGKIPVFIKTRHLYIAINRLKEELQSVLKNREHWKPNAIAFTKRYIDKGLRDRAITRDIEWGIEVPKDGYADKRIYIWAENVLGYLSTCFAYCEENQIPFESFWNDSNTKHYYVHGKDNIPFHTIILPSLLLASGKEYNQPDYITSSEHLTLEGRKISTRENWAVWAKDLIGRYNPDSIRYYMIANNPDKRDSDFSWQEFLYCNNSELLGAYGNFINRTLAFIIKSFKSTIPQGNLDSDIKAKVEKLFKKTGELITRGEIKPAIRAVFTFIREANKYFDAQKPWLTVKSDIKSCSDTLCTCVFIIANLALLLEPFLPESSDTVINWLSLDRKWKSQTVSGGYKVSAIRILFERLENNIIGEETEKLS